MSCLGNGRSWNGVNKHQNLSDCEHEKQLKVNRLDEFCAARMHIVLAAVNPAFLIFQCARRIRRKHLQSTASALLAQRQLLDSLGTKAATSSELDAYPV